MNVMFATAALTQDEADNILDELEKLPENPKVVLVGTGEELDYYYRDAFEMNLTVRQLENKPRPYAEVMEEKIRAIEPFCDDDSVVFCIDPDYSLNIHVVEFIDKIFSENSEVNYLSLLRGPGVSDGDITLSGFRFRLWGSCMGGSIVARWSVFKKHVAEFFAECGNKGMFDQDFWNFLHLRYFTPRVVYTLADSFSLIQHCNLGSRYRNSGGHARFGHLYAVNFDGKCNPFSLIGG